MRKNMFTASIAILFVLTTDAYASDVNCKLETTVTGTVNTINLTESIQVGTIHLQLTSTKNGEIIYEEDGGVIGRVTSQEELTGRSTLDHTIIFSDGSTIETNGDEAQITGPTSDYPFCSFTVIEKISNFWGTKRFKRASGEIIANGEVSFCEGDNGNSFTLSGMVCLK